MQSVYSYNQSQKGRYPVFDLCSDLGDAVSTAKERDNFYFIKNCKKSANNVIYFQKRLKTSLFGDFSAFTGK